MPKRVKITWLPIIKKRPSKKICYGTVDFPNQENNWSVVIEFDKIPASGQENFSMGGIRFLADEAPEYLFDVYKEFYINEGPHKVAKAEICQELVMYKYAEDGNQVIMYKITFSLAPVDAELSEFELGNIDIQIDSKQVQQKVQQRIWLIV